VKAIEKIASLDIAAVCNGHGNDFEVECFDIEFASMGELDAVRFVWLDRRSDAFD